MKNASYYRALASLCRQQAAYKPDQTWQLIAQAQHWEHLAESEITRHFKECNVPSSRDFARVSETPYPNDQQSKTIVAA